MPYEALPCPPELLAKNGAKTGLPAVALCEGWPYFALMSYEGQTVPAEASAKAGAPDRI
jgi:hypothetical protein